jgi:3-oxoacyl-ACP reductase-like protein
MVSFYLSINLSIYLYTYIRGVLSRLMVVGPGAESISNAGSFGGNAVCREVVVAVVVAKWKVEGRWPLAAAAAAWTQGTGSISFAALANTSLRMISS